jgi:hypothetical protein
VYFYELHEGDDEIYSDILLVHEEEYSPQEFFELVQSIRHNVATGYEEDTLSEAVAAALEREHGFIFVSDARLTAAVNVSKDEDENYLADLEAELAEDADFLTLQAELDLDGTRNN